MVDIIRASEPGCVEVAVRLLSDGQLICYPTDTVYGIGAAATNDAAVRRLYAVKGRALDKPMPLLIPDETAATWVAEVTPVARTLMHRFWPGGLTIVMRKAEGFRSLALAKQQRIALRVPDDDIVRDIIRSLGEPIVGTSANRSGGRAPRSAPEAALHMGEMVALVIDGGPPTVGQESTVIDITVEPPSILRTGAVSNGDIEGALGRAVV